MAKRGDQLRPDHFRAAQRALHAAAVEMGGVLKHSSYSPIIREMDDFSCAIFRADGDLVAQADFIPAQLGAMSLVVKAIIDRWARLGCPRRRVPRQPPLPGRDAHAGPERDHMPVFTGRKLFGWVGTTAHHIDVGGVRPGTEGPDLEQVLRGRAACCRRRSGCTGRARRTLTCSTWWRRRCRDPVSTVSDLRAQRPRA